MHTAQQCTANTYAVHTYLKLNYEHILLFLFQADFRPEAQTTIDDDFYTTLCYLVAPESYKKSYSSKKAWNKIKKSHQQTVNS